MPIVEFKMPRMGESITDATIISWSKQVGDAFDAEDVLLEVATDKVDSEVSIPFGGIIKEIRFQKDEVVKVGQVLAIIDASESSEGEIKTAITKETSVKFESNLATVSSHTYASSSSAAQALGFLSPLIRNIVVQENISLEELQIIPTSGENRRIQKSDIFNYLKNRKSPFVSRLQSNPVSNFPKPVIRFEEGKDRIVEMDRMRRMIADHMVYSKQTSPHVTSYLEIDVTNLADWRNSVKADFEAKHAERLTFTPLFVQAVSRAIEDYPMVNVSVDGNNIIVHSDIHIGMATALPSGNLIVPVVREAQGKDLVQLAHSVNLLSESARTNKLKPDQVQGSTFTISNVGTFGSLMGTPIINQPEAAILAFGVIKRRAEVMNTERGEEIAIRSMMYLSLSFDHRIIDGQLGGSFLRKVGDYLEKFDITTAI